MRETTKWWIAQHLSLYGEAHGWVLEPNGIIKMSNLTFTAKFLWLLVQHCVFPSGADNIVTLDCAVLMAVMVRDFRWTSRGCCRQ